MASGWHRELIKARVRMSGTTLTALATDNDLEVSTVRKALSRPSPRGQDIIARQLGVTPQTIWPDRYDADGHPVDGRKRSRPGRAAERQKRGAG